MRKVVLVTGGSRGHGAAPCHWAAQKGMGGGVNSNRKAQASNGWGGGKAHKTAYGRVLPYGPPPAS